MSLMLRLQVLAIAMAASSIPYVRLQLGAVMPTDALWAHHLAVGAFVAWWIGTIVWIRSRGPIDDTPDGWYPHSLWVFWLGNISTIAASGIAMSYAGPEMRLINALLCAAPVAVEVIGTVRSPVYGRRGLLGTLAPLGIPVGLTAWFLLSDAPERHVVVVFYAAFTAGLLLLREYLQNLVDTAYAAQQDAEAVRDSRTRFLASASHDLGQPLQAARLSFDQALRLEPGAARERAVGRTHWALDAMEQQLRQILDHLRLEAQQIAPAILDVRLGSMFARLAELHEPAARLAGAVVVAVDSDLVVRGDPALLERSLGNFVANAVRHAQARRVLIGARRRGHQVVAWVIDDGRGIAEADRGGLFEEYVQGTRAPGEIRGGFGLGLASARRMAELMGGQAGHEPRWRNGSAFWLALPRAAPAAKRA